MGQTILECPAIVLNCYDHGESDKIVTLFCSEIGLITGIAKGAHRSKKRFVNTLEIFTLLKLYYHNSRQNSLAFIHKAEHLNSFINLRKDIHLYNCANVIRELVLLTSRELSGDEGLFELIKWCLEALDTKDAGWTTLSIFLVRLPDILGYRPDFSICNLCRQPISQSSSYQSNSLLGILVCEKCRIQSQNLQPLSHGTIKFLDSARKLPLNRVHRLRPNKQIIKESITLMRRYLRQLFQKDIHSWKILTEMESSRLDSVSHHHVQ